MSIIGAHGVLIVLETQAGSLMHTPLSTTPTMPRALQNQRSIQKTDTDDAVGVQADLSQPRVCTFSALNSVKAHS